MKILPAVAAMLLALSSAAVAAETCDGHNGEPPSAACLQINQAKLQNEIEGLRHEIAALREENAAVEAKLAKASVPPAAVAALPPAPAGWIEDERGCKVWNANPGPNETIAWTGPCRHGIANGEGALIWYWSGSPHGTFVGTLRNGHYHRGVQVWSTGNRFDGSYRNDRAEGSGTYRTTDGQVYSGRWVNGCFRDGPRRAAIGVPVDECMN